LTRRARTGTMRSKQGGSWPGGSHEGDLADDGGSPAGQLADRV
jgi:hypothetical protein